LSRGFARGKGERQGEGRKKRGGEERNKKDPTHQGIDKLLRANPDFPRKKRGIGGGVPR